MSFEQMYNAIPIIHCADLPFTNLTLSSVYMGKSLMLA